MIKKHVVIEVFGGVAEVSHASAGVEVTVLDYDNLVTEKTEKQCSALRVAALRQAVKDDERFRAQQQADQVALASAIGMVKFARGSMDSNLVKITLKQLRNMRRRILKP